MQSATEFPASSSGLSNASSASSASTPSPPYTPEPCPYRGIKLNDLKLHDPSDFVSGPLTISKPLGGVEVFSGAGSSRKSSARFHIAHPYSRLQAKKGEVKRRKIWKHAFEKHIFTPYEISTIGAPCRRGIYTSSLEAHIDDLHAQLLDIGFYTVPFHELEPFKGLNSKTAKSMVAGLQHDASTMNPKLLELNRAIKELQDILKANP